MIDRAKHNELRRRLALQITGMFVMLALALLAVFVCLHAFVPSVAFDLFGYRYYTISYTGSMEPLLQYNDLICVQKIHFDDIEVGDIITFEAQTRDGDTMVITHEVIEVFVDSVTGLKSLGTQGRNVDYPDLIPVTATGQLGTNKYIGKYSHKNTWLGNTLAYLRSPFGLIMLLVNSMGIAGCILTIHLWRDMD